MLLVFTFVSEGERDKFEFLYEKYKRLMLKKAYDILRDSMLAEDAVSEAFMRIYKNLDKIEDPSSGRSASFVVTVVKNTALTILAKSKSQLPGGEVLEETQEDDFDLEEHVLSSVSAEGIFGLIGELSEDLRGAFLLKYGQDLSHRDIAVILGVTENNVTVRIHRAKKKLAELLVKGGHIRETR
ncbi:MAG: RNA polymerase sigma factor [Oscillospiraceae bacterium]|nr:RNA polymerase sigma factor [Oscillospiraceae bacterium]